MSTLSATSCMFSNIRISSDTFYYGTVAQFLCRVNIVTLDMYTHSVYHVFMIKSFADKETEKIYKQIYSKKFPCSIQPIALRKLLMIANAGCVEDLRVPPGNRLEKLEGDRKGQYSIRINDQYRICFHAENSDFYDVELVDYHK